MHIQKREWVETMKKAWQKYMKEHADLEPIVMKYREYTNVLQSIADSKEILQEESDEEESKKESKSSVLKELFNYDIDYFVDACDTVGVKKCVIKECIKELKLDEIESAFKDIPSFKIDNEYTLIDLLVNNGIASSRREAREFISAGSILINGDKVTDENEIISKDKAIEGKAIVVRRGKKKYYMGMFE